MIAEFELRAGRVGKNPRLRTLPIKPETGSRNRARQLSASGPSFADCDHYLVVMGLLEAGNVVLRDALRILGVLRLGACVMCSRVSIWVEG